MSGPVSMALGPFAFEAIGFHYGDLSRRTLTPWAEQPVVGRRDAQQWLGPEREEVAIKGVLFPREFGGQASLDGIVAASNEGVPMMLVSGDAGAGAIHGFYTVQAVEEDRSFIDRSGRARRNAYQIRLLRYEGDAPGPSPLTSFVSLSGTLRVGPVSVTASINL